MPVNQSFQRLTTLNRPMVARPALNSGSTMLINTRKCPAPSMRAASNSESGIVLRMNVRRMITL